MFTDCPLGSRLVSWQVELPTPERLGGWLHTVEASKIQIVCRKFVRMSFHGLIIALEWILDDILFSVFNHCQNIAWYESMPSSLDFAFRPKSGPRSSEYAATPCRSEWEVEINTLMELDRFQGFVWRTHWFYFVSSNPWRPFKHIEG